MSDSERTLADLGALVLRAREAKGWGRRKAAETGVGPSSPVTWEKIEKGQPVQRLTFAGIEKALGWPPGSMEDYLNGGPEPTPVEPEPDTSGLPPRVNEATYSELVDAIRTHHDVGLPPRIDGASYDQLLEELRRRHEADRAELARRLYPALVAADHTETAESATARGMIPVGPSAEGDSDAAGGGQR